MKTAILARLMPTADVVEKFLDLLALVLQRMTERHSTAAEGHFAKADSHRDAAARVVESLHEKAEKAGSKGAEALDKADHAMVLAERIKTLRG